MKKHECWKGLGREPPFREDSSAEAKKSRSLEAVIRERLKRQAGKVLACAVVICEV